MITAENRIQHAYRGARVAEVREALGLTGDEFATLLQGRLEALGWQVQYDKAKVSRLENGRRHLTIEEAVVIAALDPLKRDVRWLAIGKSK